MGKRKKYLTKSKFKIAHECPTKLYYQDNKTTYENKKIQNDFLLALAEGGFQVGELAKLYIPGGTNVDSLDSELALEESRTLLQKEKVTIYEPAVAYDNFLVRVDILRKSGNQIDLIEVKAKSMKIDNRKTAPEGPFRGARKPYYLLSDFESYLFDIAFQTMVVQRAYPTWKVTPYLFLMDKTKVAPTDSLHQNFLLAREDGRTYAKVVRQPSEMDLNPKIMVQVDVSEEVNLILEGLGTKDQNGVPLVDLATELAKKYSEGIKMVSPIGAKCANCEFHTKPGDLLASGRNECLALAHGLNQKSLNEEPLVFELWNSTKKGNLAVDKKKIFLGALEESDIAPKTIKPSEKPGLTKLERQMIQIRAAKNKDVNPFLDVDGLKLEIESFKAPFHFIDFETTATAIPFHKGLPPYAGLAFQFSHHVIDKEGRIRHEGQYLHSKPGEFPNFEFARNLKDELSGDEGTIFRWAQHENTYLNLLIRQLEDSDEEDRDELIEFFKTITTPQKDEAKPWKPTRPIIDQLELTKRYFWHPLMKGSNSIKAVLPAVLKTSQFLKEKYSKPIYGLDCEIPSLNLQKAHAWVELDENGEVRDPYKSLPNVLPDFEGDYEKLLYCQEELNQGGAAMTAWARMQFTEMTKKERDALRGALLRYCELDTMAMCFVWEYWMDALESKSQIARMA